MKIPGKATTKFVTGTIERSKSMSNANNTKVTLNTTQSKFP